MSGGSLLAFELLLQAHPDVQRARDEEAIEHLCDVLDRGGAPGRGWRRQGELGELWSEILRRRITNQYHRQRGTRAQWMHRHFHVRRIVRPEEGDQLAATHVAQIWNLSPASVLCNAARAPAKRAALEWLHAAEGRARTQLGTQAPPDAAVVYEIMERDIVRIAAEFSKHKKLRRTSKPR